MGTSTYRQSISWISAYDAAGTIVDVLDTDVDITHLVHPKPIPWNDIASAFSNKLQVPLVSYDEWFQALESKLNEMGSDPNRVEKAYELVPALRLINFFRSAKGKTSLDTGREPFGFPALSLEKAQACSHTLRASEPLGAADVERWLSFWRKSGFLS